MRLSCYSSNVKTGRTPIETHYPSGRTWANIRSSFGYASVIKTGTRRIIRLDELSFVMRFE